jgi:hypothetical protein
VNLSGIKSSKGMLILGLIILIAVTAAFLAFRASGPMDTEERFMHTLGIAHEEADTPAGIGIYGFSLEGQPFRYVVVLGILLLLCVVAYRYFRI